MATNFDPSHWTFNELAEELINHSHPIRTDTNVAITDSKSDAGVLGLIDITIRFNSIPTMIRAIRFIAERSNSQFKQNEDGTYRLAANQTANEIWQAIVSFIDDAEQDELAEFIDYVQPLVSLVK